MGRAFSGTPPRSGSFIWTNQTALAGAGPEHGPGQPLDRFPVSPSPAKIHLARAQLARDSLDMETGSNPQHE